MAGRTWQIGYLRERVRMGNWESFNLVFSAVKSQYCKRENTPSSFYAETSNGEPAHSRKHVTMSNQHNHVSDPRESVIMSLPVVNEADKSSSACMIMNSGSHSVAVMRPQTP